MKARPAFRLVGKYYIITPDFVEEVDTDKVDERVNKILENVFKESAREYSRRYGCVRIERFVNGVVCVIKPGMIEVGEGIYEAFPEDEERFLRKMGLSPSDVERVVFIEAFSVNRYRPQNFYSEVIRDWYLVVSRTPPKKEKEAK